MSVGWSPNCGICTQSLLLGTVATGETVPNFEKTRTMAKNDSDLFDRLRRAGLRKQVAKTLSEIEGAGKKAQRAAHTMVSDLRSLADELERRLPGVEAAPASKPATRRTAARRPAARKPAARKPAARKPAARATAASPARLRRPAATRGRAAASGASGARTPRGQNKAKILAALKSGPKTAAEVAKETGIGTGVAGSTLTKMAASGEVVKATRGYGLPKGA
jgi:hypothetical protein